VVAPVAAYRLPRGARSSGREHQDVALALPSWAVGGCARSRACAASTAAGSPTSTPKLGCGSCISPGANDDLGRGVVLRLEVKHRIFHGHPHPENLDVEIPRRCDFVPAGVGDDPSHSHRGKPAELSAPRLVSHAGQPRRSGRVANRITRVLWTVRLMRPLRSSRSATRHREKGCKPAREEGRRSARPARSFRHLSPRVPDSTAIGGYPRPMHPRRPNAPAREITANRTLFAGVLAAGMLDRTQEVGGSSPPSSIIEEALHARGFRRLGDRRGSAAIALRFKH
jgi:hypothetical protein